MEGSSPYADDTWAWDGTTWEDVSPDPSPSPRDAIALAYDSARGKSVLFGGNTDTTYGDTWELEWGGASWMWTERFPEHSPPDRSFHALTYAPECGGVVLFGGCYNNCNDIFGDMWVWNGADWEEIPLPGASPSDRAHFAMVYDSARGVIVLFSGWDSDYNCLDDTWEFDCATQTWTEMSPAASPSPRYHHEMAYDSERGVVVLFGGYCDGDFLDDTWEWDGTTWAQQFPDSSPPPLSSHSMAYDPARQAAVLFGGGVAGPDSSDKTWEYGGNCDDGGDPIPWLSVRCVAGEEGDRIGARFVHGDPGTSVTFLLDGARPRRRTVAPDGTARAGWAHGVDPEHHTVTAVLWDAGEVLIRGVECP